MTLECVLAIMGWMVHPTHAVSETVANMKVGALIEDDDVSVGLEEPQCWMICKCSNYPTPNYLEWWTRTIEYGRPLKMLSSVKITYLMCINNVIDNIVNLHVEGNSNLKWGRFLHVWNIFYGGFVWQCSPN